MPLKERLYGKGLCSSLKSPFTVTCTWGDTTWSQGNWKECWSEYSCKDWPDCKKCNYEELKRSFVLLKVVSLSVVGDNGAIVTSYGLLNTAAVSSMITSQLAEKLKLQGTPEKVSINAVTRTNHDCELAKVSFMVGPADQDGPCFPVRHTLTVENLNVSDRYCPQIRCRDLSEWSNLKDLDFPNVPVDLNKVYVCLIGVWCIPLVIQTYANFSIFSKLHFLSWYYIWNAETLHGY